jgi:16S rRNA (cytosine1402-N4)-methyltransferase
MDRRQPTTAADIVNSYSQAKLADIFYTYGGEKNSRRLAAAVIEARNKKPLTTTGQLTEVVTAVTNPRYVNKTLSRVFQSLRLVVNDEVSQLENGLTAAADLLSVGGRLVVITYHSLEDRIVKNCMRDRARSRASKPGGIDDIPADLRILTKKPQLPSATEIAENSRARSAKLRVAEKC